MIIPPADVTGPSILDVVVQRTRVWSRNLWGSLAKPSSPSAAPAPDASLQACADHLTTVAATDGPATDHALLVLLGQFAQKVDLLALLERVPIAQKTVDHRPQTKLIQFLVGILAGLDYLHDFNHAPDPLLRDTAVMRAWGQDSFAHYSGVSRTLAVADATTLQAVIASLQQVSRPFLERELLALVRSNQPLVVDLDLTGREVSPRSTDYPEAAFGWMDNAVSKGYQSAISSLSGGPSGRLLLCSQRYGGRTTSAESLRAAVSAVEQTLGTRPRRRTALVQAQIDELAARLAGVQQTRTQLLAQHQTAHTRLGRLAEQPATPAPRLRAQEQRLARLASRLRRLEHELWQLRQQQVERQTWLEQLRSENQALVAVVEVVIRLDAGFASDANLTWLIEMGYTVLSKVHSGHTTKRLQRRIGDESEWTPVGANAEALALGQVRLGEGRYGLDALQVRYHLPQGLRHTTLLYYGEAPPPPAALWFGQYNARQTAEAAIKENKAVFSMRRPLVRSPIGMQLQEQFALFAANFVRWAAAWAKEQLREVPPALAAALSEVKTLVRVVAHSRARLVETPLGCALVFDSHSAFAGAVLIVRGQAVYQNVLPLFTVGATTPPGVT